MCLVLSCSNNAGSVGMVKSLIKDCRHLLLGIFNFFFVSKSLRFFGLEMAACMLSKGTWGFSILL